MWSLTETLPFSTQSPEPCQIQAFLEAPDEPNSNMSGVDDVIWGLVEYWELIFMGKVWVG